MAGQFSDRPGAGEVTLAVEYDGIAYSVCWSAERGAWAEFSTPFTVTDSRTLTALAADVASTLDRHEVNQRVASIDWEQFGFQSMSQQDVRFGDARTVDEDRTVWVAADQPLGVGAPYLTVEHGTRGDHAWVLGRCGFGDLTRIPLSLSADEVRAAVADHFAVLAEDYLTEQSLSGAVDHIRFVVRRHVADLGEAFLRNRFDPKDKVAYTGLKRRLRYLGHDALKVATVDVVDGGKPTAVAVVVFHPWGVGHDLSDDLWTELAQPGGIAEQMGLSRVEVTDVGPYGAGSLLCLTRRPDLFENADARVFLEVQASRVRNWNITGRRVA